MAIADLLTLPLTVTRRTGGVVSDELGNETPATETPETVGELQQLRSEETNGDVTVTDWRLFLPAGTGLDTGDAVTLEDGRTFEVVGDPWPVRDPRTGEDSHVEAVLRRAGGADE